MTWQDFSGGLPELPFHVAQYLTGPHQNFHYVVGDPVTRTAAIVDPAFNVDRIFALGDEEGWDIEEVWLTHAHWDHVSGAAEAVTRGARTVRVGAPAASHADVQAAQEAGAEIVPFDADTKFHVGQLPVSALLTPGHQPEAICYVAGPGAGSILLGGDTLFVGSCGRTDFPGGNTNDMFASMAKLRKLPAGLIVLPGHHYHDQSWRKLGDETVHNPALATIDRAAFNELHCLTN